MNLPVTPDLIFMTLFQRAVRLFYPNNPWSIGVCQQAQGARFCRLPNFFWISLAGTTLRATLTLGDLVRYRTPLVAVTALEGGFPELTTDMPDQRYPAPFKFFVHPCRICINPVG